jgi:integrase
MWRDVDFRKGLITVERSLLNTPERGVFIDSTKNFASRRVLKLPQIGLQLLEDYKAWQSDTLSRFNVTNEDDFMFTALDGKPIHLNAFSKWFNAFVKRKATAVDWSFALSSYSFFANLRANRSVSLRVKCRLKTFSLISGIVKLDSSEPYIDLAAERNL